MSQDSDGPSEEDQQPPQSPAPLIAPEFLPCPDCRGQMVEGWMPDLVEHSLGGAKITLWHPGPPRPATGLFHTSNVQPPKISEGIPIRTFRCIRCGFLKSYARAVG